MNAGGTLDRSSPRFGPGWIEFPVLNEFGRVAAFYKETIDFSACTWAPANEIDLARYFEWLTERTRDWYNFQKQPLLMTAAQRVEAARPSR